IPNQSQPFLLIAGLLALIIASYRGVKVKRPMLEVSRKQIVQAFPVVMILVLIGTVSAAWMYSGVVPTLICYGMETLKPATFLLTTCAVCAFVSVLSGSSWTTIATIGVAFMGIGIMWGFNMAMTAGAIISGAYFGDKISPMSDTTVLASSACGVDLFEHIRNMLVTTIPVMSIALIAYGIIGYMTDYRPIESSNEVLASLHATFNISPWTLMIPLATILVLICRINTVWTLVISTLLGVGGIFLFQPNVAAHLVAESYNSYVLAVAGLLCGETSINVGNDLLSNLITTGGIAGMWTTIRLVICAMFFGTCMMASGMLNVITGVLTNRLARRQSIVSSTVLTGILLNSFTGDQYLSIILNGSVYRDLYQRNGYPPYILSRTVEDSTSVTSVLIPWNSCGITQSTVLGVGTLSYMPFCFFNIASPIITIIVAWIVSWRSSFKKTANVAV
ncbi:MAG: sodium:proton antiporter, partial [Muribaculum sp.]|nr:sodium:proton antiporter [Muribaculum sp.]